MDLNHARLPIPPLRHGKAASEGSQFRSILSLQKQLACSNSSAAATKSRLTPERTEKAEIETLIRPDLFRALRVSVVSLFLSPRNGHSESRLPTWNL